MTCQCKPPARFVSRQSIPAPGGPADFVSFVSTAGGAIESFADDVGGAVDSVFQSACEALATAGIGGEPLAAWWNSSTGQSLAFWGGFMPPPILPFNIMAITIADAMATCTVTRASARAMCRQVAVFRLLAGLVDNDFAQSLVEEAAGKAVGAVFTAIGTMCRAGITACTPLCTGDMPRPEDIVKLGVELAEAANAIQEAGGPQIFDLLSPVIAAAIGEDAVEAIQDGASGDEVVRLAMDDYRAAVGQVPLMDQTFSFASAGGVSLADFLPSQSPTPSPPSPSPSPPQPGGGVVIPAALLFALLG